MRLPWSLAVAFVSTLALSAACSDTPSSPQAERLRVVVASIDAADIAFVSLPQGTVPDGVKASIRRTEDDSPSSVTLVVDGGFDPIPVPVQGNDSITVTVTDASGTPVLSVASAVKPKRPPVIVRTSPPRKKSDVPVNASIVIVFSEPMNAPTVTTGIRLFRGPTPVAGTVQLQSGTGTVAVFKPDAALDPNTNYRVVVNGSVADHGGQPIGEEQVIDFSTGHTSTGTVASIRISPDTVYIKAFRPGTPLTYQLTASVRDAAGVTLAEEPVAWTSSDAASLTVSGNGLVTVLQGGGTISAAAAGQVAHAIVYVQPGPPATATLTPASSTLAIDDTVRLAVRYRDARGLITAGTTAFSSSTPAVTVTPAAQGDAVDSVLVIGRSEGSATVSASTGSITATSSVTVISARAVSLVTTSPPSLETVPDGALQFTARATDAAGVLITGRPITWESLEPTIASVASDGTVTAAQAGVARIVASIDGVKDTSEVTVRLLTFKSVFAAADAGNTCLITTEDRAYCWGRNFDGELGIGVKSIPPRTVDWPVAIPGMTFSSLAPGGTAACGRDAGGVWYCWGSNWLGQLGDGTLIDRLTPARVTVAPTFTSIAPAGIRPCGLTASGAAYCWGEFGNQPTRTPVAVPGGHTFVSLHRNAAVFDEVYKQVTGTCGLRTDGAVYCWFEAKVTPVRAAPGAPPFTTLAASNHACGLTAAGKLWCWGVGIHGQLGNSAAPVDFVTEAVPVSPDRVFSTVAVNNFNTCALTIDGDAYCWGLNQQGQLGIGTSNGPDSCGEPVQTPVSCSKSPVLVSGGLKFKALSAAESMCAVTIDNVAYCWGRGRNGNGPGASMVPVRVGGQP